MSTYIKMSTEGLNAPDKITDSQKITAGYFSDSVGKLIAAKIHSSSLTDTNEKYYFGITNTPSASGATQFTVAYGDIHGSGSDDDTTDIKSPTEAIYKQWASTLLAENEVTGGFKISRGDGAYTTPSNAKVGTTQNNYGGNSAGVDESIYVLVGKRARFKDRMNKKNWTLVLSGSTSEGGSTYGTSSLLFGTSGPTGSVHEVVIGGVSFTYVHSASLYENSATQIFIDNDTVLGVPKLAIHANATASANSLRDAINNSGSLHGLNISASNTATTTGMLMKLSGSIKGAYANYTITTGSSAPASNTFLKSFTSMGGGAGSAGNAVLHLTDDSATTNNPHHTVAGPRYNIVSGSNGTVSGSGASDRVYGWFYPEMGAYVFSKTELSASIPGIAASASAATIYNNDNFRGFGNSNTISAANYKNALRFINCLKLGGSYMQFRSEEDVTSTHYFCRLRANQMNFSNNPTFVSGSANEIRHSTMQGNPTVYITGVGLYSGDGTLAAIGKLSTPLKKNYSREATIKLKLDW